MNAGQRVFNIAELAAHICRCLTKGDNDDMGVVIAHRKTLLNVACTSRSMFLVACQVLWHTAQFPHFYATALKVLDAPVRVRITPLSPPVCLLVLDAVLYIDLVFRLPVLPLLLLLLASAP